MTLRNRGPRAFMAIALLLTWLLLAGLVFPLASARAGAIFSPAALSESAPSVSLPESADLSFSDLPSFPEGGAIDFSMLDPSLIDRLGYDPSVFWKAGDRLESILDLGTLAPYTTLANWSLNTISGFVPGAKWASIPLSAAVFLSNHSIEDIVDAVPLLGGYRLGEVKPLYDFLASESGWNAIQAGTMAGLPLSQIADSVFGTVKFDLGEFDFEKYLVSDVPNLDSMPFSNLVDWEKIKLGDIPFLDVVKWGSFGLGVVDLLTTAVARVDVVFGDAEGNQKEKGRETVTGSYKEGFAVPCDEESCSYLELTDALALGSLPGLPSVHGKQWISGKSQKVKGGSGFLVGEEPTGRNPFGPVFKVVMTEASESEGKATFSLYFRLCFSFFGISACTPYILGPFPWFPASEGNIIILGLGGSGDDNSSGGNGPVPSREELERLLREKNPELAGKIDRIAGQQPDYGEPGYTDDAVSTEADCEVYRGIEMASLQRAIADIESRGSGDYYAVGDWSPCGRGCTIVGGHALGKYQYMTYREEVIRAFTSKPGGREILQRSYRNSISKAELATAIRTYLPPAKQEELRQKDWRARISGLRAKGFSEEETVRELACQHYGKCGDRNNPTYADDALKNYRKYKQGGFARKKCAETQNTTGVCTGKHIWPAKGTITSEYSRWRCVLRCAPHNGIDIGNGLGTAVVASDGGKVISAGWNNGGFGNLIVIQHCNGDVTYYAHLHKIRVRGGQSVQQGQIIGEMGTTGSSTGVHLHYEYRPKGGGAIDPRKILPRRGNPV